MIIFCWTVPVAEVDNGVFAGPAAGMVFWILLRASCDEEEKVFFSPMPLWLLEIFCAIVGVVDVWAGLLCMVGDERAAHWLDCMLVDVPRSFVLLAVGAAVVNGDVREQS